jgi:hypothetical protein
VLEIGGIRECGRAYRECVRVPVPLRRELVLRMLIGRCGRPGTKSAICTSCEPDGWRWLDLRSHVNLPRQDREERCNASHRCRYRP